MALVSEPGRNSSFRVFEGKLELLSCPANVAKLKLSFQAKMVKLKLLSDSKLKLQS